MRRPARVLMTLDAVGGVWNYAIDLCRACARHGVGFLLVGQGPRPNEAQRAAVAELDNVELAWIDEPLDWMAPDQEALAHLPGRLAALAARFDVDLLHLNLPSQANGLRALLLRPIVVVSHSCVVTWWDAVRGGALPRDWQWRKQINRSGFDAADAVIVPSHSHAEQLERCYGPIARLRLVPNASATAAPRMVRQDFVFAAGRWWDDGKNARTLDRAARDAFWPVVMAGPCAGPTGQVTRLERVEAVGVLPHDEVARRLARAGIVVSPSIYEPFGLVALEAAKTGAPLVLADIPTYRELWSDAALFVAPRNAAAMAAAMNLFATSPELRAEYGTRAAARAARFTVEAQVAATLHTWRAAAERATVPVAQGAA